MNKKKLGISVHEAFTNNSIICRGLIPLKIKCTWESTQVKTLHNEVYCEKQAGPVLFSWQSCHFCQPRLIQKMETSLKSLM